jgi:hypothetical protein
MYPNSYPTLLSEHAHEFKKEAFEQLWCFMLHEQHNNRLSLHECNHQLKEESERLKSSFDAKREAEEIIYKFVNMTNEMRQQLLMTRANQPTRFVTIALELVRVHSEKYPQRGEINSLLAQLLALPIPSSVSYNQYISQIKSIPAWFGDELAPALTGTLATLLLRSTKEEVAHFHPEDFTVSAEDNPSGECYLLIGDGTITSGYWTREMLDTLGIEKQAQRILSEALVGLVVGGALRGFGSPYHVITRIK